MSQLIQPVLQGHALIAQIRATRPLPGTLAVWWLGQSGFLFKSSAGTLVIDPYLSESLTLKYAHTDRPHVRMTAAPCAGGDLPDVGLVLVSHRHTDHLDPDTLLPLLDANPDARVALPAAIVDHATTRGLPAERLVELTAGDSVARAGFAVRAIPSAHESLDTDPMGRHLYLGFLVESQGIRFYHPGDSIVYDGLAESLQTTSCDAFFLPINGRDPRRGVPGNMTSAEAVNLAGRCGPRHLIPHHYDMFTFNTVPVSEFLTEARRLPARVTPVVLRCGQRWELAP